MRRPRSLTALCMLCVLEIVGLGRHRAVAQTSAPALPTVSIQRHAEWNGPVWPGDFNGDGITDLVFSAAPDALGNGDIRIRVGDATGAFFQAAPDRHSFSGMVLGVGDFNNDRRLDVIAVRRPTVFDWEVSVLPGLGDGSVDFPFAIDRFSTMPFAASADLDGDGNRDLILIGDGAAHMYRGGGEFNSFGPRMTLPTGASPRDGLIVDVNGDGRRDIVVANHEGQSISILLNQGAFAFTASDMPLDRQANDVAAADFNGDGKMDLVVTTSEGWDADFFYTAGFAYVLFGNGNGTFAQPVKYQVAPGPLQVVVGDFNRDGIVDIATGNASAIFSDDACSSGFKTWDSVSILPGRGDGTFAAPSSFSLGVQSNLSDNRFRESLRSLNTSDLNGDRATDLIASWGALLFNRPLDPNWAPTVDAGPDFTANPDHTAHLRAIANDVDQDMLAYRWVDSAGEFVPSVPNPCVLPQTLGQHTYTVTVDDGHGHTATDSVVVDFGSGGTAETTVAVTTPKAGEVIPAGAQTSIGFHIEDSTQVVRKHSLFYSVDNGAHWNAIWECNQIADDSSQPGVATSRDETCAWQNPGPPSTQARVQVVLQDGNHNVVATGASGPFTIVAAIGAVPPPWKHQDVGAVAVGGTATYDGGIFTVKGSGADIWGTADEFHFVYESPHVNVSVTEPSWWEITTRVDSVQNVQAWTKAGLMIRDGLGASARHASLFITPGKGIAFQRRTSTGGTSINTSGPLLTAPVWLKLAISGPTISAYYRKALTDPWTLLGRETFDEILDVLVGLAVTSHADGTLASAAFSNVTGHENPVLRSVDVGTTGGSTTSDTVITTMTSTGADIWGTSDQFRFADANWATGNTSITVRVRSVQNVNAWTKAGVMFRQESTSLDHAPNDRYVFVMVTPGKGVTMQYRSAVGANAASVPAATVAGTAPGWVRMTKADDTYTGYWSKDGVAWTRLGSVTVSMDAGLTAGLALTSHDVSTAATASFDDLLIQ